MKVYRGIFYVICNSRREITIGLSPRVADFEDSDVRMFCVMFNDFEIHLAYRW